MQISSHGVNLLNEHDWTKMIQLEGVRSRELWSLPYPQDTREYGVTDPYIAGVAVHTYTLLPNVRC